MAREFNNKAPFVKLASAVAALLVTVFIGEGIDFLASDYAMADPKYRPVQMAHDKSSST